MRNDDLKAEPVRTRMLRYETLALLLLVLLVTALRIWQLPHFPYDDDEPGTIAVMQNIVTTGLPLRETGLLYWRAVLAHYLLAIPLFFVPVSETSVRLVSALASGGVLLVAFAMARSVAGRVAGWICVAVLAASSYEQNFASLARFYMLFQFFFLTSLYFAGRYFIEGRDSDGKWCLFFSILTAGSHEMSIELLPVLILALYVGGRYELLRRVSFQACCLGLAAAFVAVYYRPEGSFVHYTALPLQPFAMADKFFFYKSIKEYAPFCFSLGLAGWIVVWHREQRTWRLYLLAFWGCLLFASLISPAEYERYMANFFPLVVVLGAVAVAWILVSGWQLCGPARERIVALRWSFVVVLVLVHLFAGRDWNINVAFGQNFKYPDQKPAHEYLLKHMLAGDLLISLDPGLSALYLGRPADYFLREKFDPGTKEFTSFSELEKTSMSVAFIDSPARLKQVIEGFKGRIWLYANHKYGGTLSPQMQNLIGSKFKLELIHEKTAVFSMLGEGL